MQNKSNEFVRPLELELEFLSQKEHPWKGPMCYFRICNLDFLNTFDPKTSYNPIWEGKNGEYMIQHRAKDFESLELQKGMRFKAKFKFHWFYHKSQKDGYVASLDEVLEQAREESPFSD